MNWICAVNYTHLKDGVSRKELYEFEIILKGGKYYAERIKPKYPENNDGSDSISDLVLENILQS